MPIAEPFENNKKLHDLVSIVEAFAQLAQTLAFLAQYGVSHRDIKPENLFWLDDCPVIGDFGMVDFPGKESVTVPNKKLGPLHYIAPEMLISPTIADGKSADVYSLAKCLWVIATGQQYPIPGEQRDSVYQTRLSTYISHPKARLLDKLISQYTRYNPTERPSMKEVEETLNLWLQEKEQPSSLRPRKFTPLFGMFFSECR
jgi:serine/threonine protein kinase